MSAIAGPAFGLTSSIVELWVASAPAAVNHWSATGGAQSTAASGAVWERPASSPGARSSVPVTTTGPVPGDAVDTRPVRTRSGPTVSPRPTWTSPATFDAGSAPTVLTPSRSVPPGSALGQTTEAAESGVSTAGSATGCSRSGRSSSSARAHATGSRIARTTSAPNRRLIAGPDPCSARTAPAPTRIASPCSTSSPIRSHDRGPSRSLADSGRSTCQARVLRSSALACTRPLVASRAAATSPSAGAGRTTYSIPRAASASTASGVGREARPRTSAVKSRSSAVSASTSSSPVVTPSSRRTV